jgi:cytochrome c oxidase subunit II
MMFRIFATRCVVGILLLTALFCTPVSAADTAPANNAPAPMEKKWEAEGYWLPEAASTYAEKVDGLFYGILYLTGVVFVITELLLLIFIIKYRRQEGRKSVYSHGSHKLEMVWTIVPALILALIAFVQKGTWDDIKRDIPNDKDTVHVQIYAEQFQWNFRYPGADGKFGTEDDAHTTKRLIMPAHKKVVFEMTSKDVIHSLFLPYMRLKQDLVPGMQIKAWVEATKTTAEMKAKRPDVKHPVTGEVQSWNYEVVCAELCGIQHGQMRANMYVYPYEEYQQTVSKLFFSEDEHDRLWSKWEVDETGKRKPVIRKAGETAHKDEKKH